jgi:hypothetical protein
LVIQVQKVCGSIDTRLERISRDYLKLNSLHRTSQVFGGNNEGNCIF